MAKEIILYNLKKDVSPEDYEAWCREYKGPLLTGLDSVAGFTLVKILGGVQGNGETGKFPEPAPSPYQYIGIMNVHSMEALNKDRESEKFQKEFFAQWFTKWVGEFTILGGMEAYDGGE